MSTRKSVVDRAIRFQSPPRVPFWFDSDRIKYSDIFTYDLSLPGVNDPARSEWGFRRSKLPNGQWEVPQEPTLAEWKQVDQYQVPEQNMANRLAGIVKASAICEDRYRLASFGLSGYSVYSALRGAELSAVDFLVETDRFVELMEDIFAFEVGFFDTLSRKGFHAIEYCDDWGPRTSSRVTLSLWQRLLKHHYARSFRRAKDSGLDIWFSTSIDCAEFFGDLRELGVNVVRLEKPYEMELYEIGRMHRGKLCFAVRLDEVVTGQKENDDVIRNLYECLAADNGGFIATIAENVPDGKARWGIDAVKRISKRKG